MKKKGCWLTGLFLLAMITVAALVIMLGNDDGDDTFDSEGRYDSTELNYMSVIYENKSDIFDFRDGFSESDACPWGFAHPGIDFFFNNNSRVLAAAPGYVFDVGTGILGEGEDFQYVSYAWVRFNETVELGYGFEPGSNETSDRDLQFSMLSVQVGDWVTQGQEIGRFLRTGDGSHIHFDVLEMGFPNDRACPRKYYAEAEYLKLMDLIDDYQTGWDLCYP